MKDLEEMVRQARLQAWTSSQTAPTPDERMLAGKVYEDLDAVMQGRFHTFS